MSVPNLNADLQGEIANLGLMLNDAASVLRSMGQEEVAKVHEKIAALIGYIIAGLRLDQAVAALVSGDVSALTDAIDRIPEGGAKDFLA